MSDYARDVSVLYEGGIKFFLNLEMPISLTALSCTTRLSVSCSSDTLPLSDSSRSPSRSGQSSPKFSSKVGKRNLNSTIPIQVTHFAVPF